MRGTKIMWTARMWRLQEQHGVGVGVYAGGDGVYAYAGDENDDAYAHVHAQAAAAGPAHPTTRAPPSSLGGHSAAATVTAREMGTVTARETQTQGAVPPRMWKSG